MNISTPSGSPDGFLIFATPRIKCLLFCRQNNSDHIAVEVLAGAMELCYHTSIALSDISRHLMETFANREFDQSPENRITRAKRRRMVKRAAMWLGVFLAIGGAVFGVMKISRSTPTAGGTASLVNAISLVDWVRGDKEAKVVIVEYSDFQCPACGAYHPVLKRLNEEFGGKIGFVYRHFPLPQHANARPAARAAEAAGRQGKFWEMHDIIFENQQEWSESQNAKDIFEKYAEALKLDTDRFKSDIDAEEIGDKVSADFESGTKSGVNATPTFFLNGKAIANPGGYDGLRNAINQAIADNS